jgi:hypothetical protein
MKKIALTISLLFSLCAVCFGQEQYFSIVMDSISGRGVLSPTFDSLPFKEKKSAILQWNPDTLHGIVKKCMLENLTREELKELSEIQDCFTTFYLGVDRRAHYCQFFVDSLTAQNLNQKLFFNLYQALTKCPFQYSDKDVFLGEKKDFNCIIMSFPLVSKKRSFLRWE